MRFTKAIIATVVLMLAIPASAQTALTVLVGNFDTAPPVESWVFPHLQSQLATVDSFYIKVPLSSTVYGVYTIPYSQDVNAVDLSLRNAAITAGVVLTANIVYVVQDGPPGSVNFSSFQTMWQTFAHEFRHHVIVPFYQGHEHGVVCTAINCTESDTGNGFSVMATGSGYFSAVLQAQFGWVAGPPEITRSGDYCIEPLETASGGVKALRWHGGRSDTWPFALEYRQPLGFDATLPSSYAPSVYDGVLIYRLSSNASGIDTTLLQATPYVSGLQDPALHLGQTWCDALGKVSQTVLSLSSTQACVRFKFGGKC